jgi:hypothetical protein
MQELQAPHHIRSKHTQRGQTETRLFGILRFAACLILLIGASGCVQQVPTGGATRDATWAAAVAQIENQERRIIALETANAALVTQVARQQGFISHLATRGPAQPSRTPRETPSSIASIEGDVIIEGGKCCIGGVAGEPLTIEVVFRAESLEAAVSEMRVSAGFAAISVQAVDRAEWEPFVEKKQFTVTPPINWTAFYVAVQFRDSSGGDSRVFRADISVEGMPPTPTLTPTS